MYIFFFNDTATTEIYTLSLHDALPICFCRRRCADRPACPGRGADPGGSSHHRGSYQGLAAGSEGDRKSTRLNSSHANISYAVFCLKKKKMHNIFSHITPPQ